MSLDVFLSRRYRVMLFGLASCLALLLLCLQPLAVRADTNPAGGMKDSAIRGAIIARPAVVRIIMQTEGTIALTFTSSATVTFPQDKPVYELTLSGSGTFISSQGDILTADHVVNPEGAYIEQVAAEAAAHIALHPEYNLGKPSTPEVLGMLQQGRIKNRVFEKARESRAFLNTYYTGTTNAANIGAFPSTLWGKIDNEPKKSSPFMDRDTAIVKSHFTFDTPYVQLGDATQVRQFDKLIKFGFPGNGDVSLKPDSLFEPSIGELTVSSRKTRENGTPLIQVTSGITHGDSGGPALNAAGEIVGITSFSLSEGDGNAFLQTTDLPRQWVKELSLDTSTGTFQNQWSQAMKNYADEKWSEASTGLEGLKRGYPNFKGVDPLLTYSAQQSGTPVATQPTPTLIPSPTATENTQASVASNQPPQSWVQENWPVLAVVGGIVVIIGSGALFGVIQRSRKASAVAKLEKQVDATLTSTPITTSASSSMNRLWPCGHSNRPTARFCAICGEPAPDQ